MASRYRWTPPTSSPGTGCAKAARMASSERTDEEKGVAVFEYYERAIPNLDDVSEAMSGKPADEVMGLLSRAVMEATPKN